MKKIVIILAVCLALILSACNCNEIGQDEKYTMNASYSYGGNLEKTEISYTIIISGAEKDIENIDAYEVLINMDYLDLMLENGPHSSQKELGEAPYFKIIGNFTFNTSGKSKEEIDKMKLMEGVKVIDKDRNEVTLKFNN
jgi:predicted small secreted protein